MQFYTCAILLIDIYTQISDLRHRSQEVNESVRGIAITTPLMEHDPSQSHTLDPISAEVPALPKLDSPQPSVEPVVKDGQQTKESDLDKNQESLPQVQRLIDGPLLFALELEDEED